MSSDLALVIGEALVDLIEARDADGSLHYHPRYGGSPLNVAVGVRRLGAGVEFVGALGEDVFGRRLRSFLRSEGIGVDASVDTGMGTVVAVAMSEAGRVDFEYFGDFSSLTQITAIEPDLVRRASVVHAGSTVFNADPAYAATIDAFGVPGPFKTIDPNPRPFLIADHSAYRSRFESAMALVDLVKLSADDIAYLYPELSLEAAALRIGATGDRTVIVTQADADTLVLDGDAVTYVAVPSIHLVDTTGAGDSFMAYVIAAVARDGPPKGTDAWRELAHHANVAAGLSCSQVGGAIAMPSWDQVQGALLS